MEMISIILGAVLSVFLFLVWLTKANQNLKNQQEQLELLKEIKALLKASVGLELTSNEIDEEVRKNRGGDQLKKLIDLSKKN